MGRASGRSFDELHLGSKFSERMCTVPERGRRHHAARPLWRAGLVVMMRVVSISSNLIRCGISSARATVSTVCDACCSARA